MLRALSEPPSLGVQSLQANSAAIMLGNATVDERLLRARELLIAADLQLPLTTTEKSKLPCLPSTMLMAMYVE